MDGEVANRDLHVAATDGDVARFLDLLLEDPYLLEEVSFACSRNLLHVATMRGQVGIVREALRISPQLARNVDSQKSSPLHIAAAQGNVEIVQELLREAPEMCWWRDGQGMNPVHIAAMNGHVGVLEVLIGEDPFPAAEKLDRGQTVLHLCLKHRRVRAFQWLVEQLGELVNVEDDDGEMVLHSAVRFRQLEAVRYLVQNHKTYELPTNSKGKTVQQISRESSQDITAVEIDRILSQRVSNSGKPVGFRGRMSDIIMVVVVLIATMAFQAAVSPPGGVWQDNLLSAHKAGEAVMAFSRPKIFKSFVDANTLAFVSSLITIILLTTGLPSKNIFVKMVVMLTMWVSIGSIGISYVVSMIVINPNWEKQTVIHVIYVFVAIFISIYGMFCFFSRATFHSTLMPYWWAREWRQHLAIRPQFRSPFAIQRPTSGP